MRRLIDETNLEKNLQPSNIKVTYKKRSNDSYGVKIEWDPKGNFFPTAITYLTNTSKCFFVFCGYFGQNTGVMSLEDLVQMSGPSVTWRCDGVTYYGDKRTDGYDKNSIEFIVKLHSDEDFTENDVNDLKEWCEYNYRTNIIWGKLDPLGSMEL